MINNESNKEYLLNSKERTIVHKGTYDEISKILQMKTILGKKFVSFSDGFPFMPMHGDTCIVFNRDILVKKCKFIKIIYSKDFFKNKKELFDYILEYKSKAGITEYITNEYQKKADKIKENFTALNNKEKIFYRKEINKIENEIQKVKDNPMWYFFKSIENENEIITYSPFKFAFDDIEKIIYVSPEFQRLYPFPKELQEKVMYMEDFYPVAIMSESPLIEEIERKKQQFLISGAEGIDINIFILHHAVAAIVKNPDLITDIKINHLDFNKIPSNWIQVMKSIDKINDPDFKIEIIDYVWRIRMLYSALTPNYKYDNNLLKKVLDMMK